MFSGLLLVLTVVALFMAKNAMNRAAAAQEEVDRLRAALDALARRVWKAGVPAEPPSVGAPAPGRAAEDGRAYTEPVVAPEPPAPEPAVVEPVVEPAAAFEAAPEPPPPPPPPRTPPPVIPPRPPFDWESLIGVKLFSWIAGIALVLAALFFLRY